eukprot:GHVP01069550.1.p1 GENE.GHVP01069550.1~~GHVP01069550.1.p1  ORF type:complete len:312 (+),score=61.17 GHVP01069550.1:75-1010(+)
MTHDCSSEASPYKQGKSLPVYTTTDTVGKLVRSSLQKGAAVAGDSGFKKILKKAKKRNRNSKDVVDFKKVEPDEITSLKEVGGNLNLYRVGGENYELEVLDFLNETSPESSKPSWDEMGRLLEDFQDNHSNTEVGIEFTKINEIDSKAILKNYEVFDSPRALRYPPKHSPTSHAGQEKISRSASENSESNSEKNEISEIGNLNELVRRIDFITNQECQNLRQPPITKTTDKISTSLLEVLMAHVERSRNLLQKLQMGVDVLPSSCIGHFRPCPTPYDPFQAFGILDRAVAAEESKLLEFRLRQLSPFVRSG